MGFSWSFYLIQKMHEQSAVRSLGVGRDKPVLDGYPAPLLSGNEAVAMPYCDNVHTACRSPGSLLIAAYAGRSLWDGICFA